MTPTPNPGYIYIPQWDKFQHYHDGRRPSWIKTYVALLDNDAYLGLSLFDRGVLHAIWLLVARNGQGRCSARADHLQRACNTPAGHMQRSLERLNQAGFITFRSRRALDPFYTDGTSRGSKEPKKEKKRRARASSSPPKTFSMNGRAEPVAGDRDPEGDELADIDYKALLNALPTVKEMP